MNKDDKGLIELTLKSIEEKIDIKFTAMHATIKANHDIYLMKLNEIEKNENKIDLKVAKLEEETRIVRLIERKPVLFVIFIVGIFVIWGILDFETVISIFK